MTDVRTCTWYCENEMFETSVTTQHVSTATAHAGYYLPQNHSQYRITAVINHLHTCITGRHQVNKPTCQLTNKSTHQQATPLLEFTCHMGSQCYKLTCHPAEVTIQPLPQPKLVLDLATPEGCKAELTQLAGYVPWWYICPKMVTHPNTNQAWHRVTSFMRRTTVATMPCHQPSGWQPQSTYQRDKLLWSAWQKSWGWKGVYWW